MTDQMLDNILTTVVMFALFITLVYLDKRLTRAEDRNESLHQRNEAQHSRLEQLKQIIKIQDALIVAKIDVILDEHRARLDRESIDTNTPLLSVDDAIAQLSYCYECFALKTPHHFKDTGHRKTPAPELSDTEQGHGN